MSDFRPRVYGASKLAQAPVWRSLRTDRPGICWTNRWPDIEGQVPDTAEFARMFWLHDIADVQRADCVLVLAPESGTLRGALIEAGAALGLGKAVVLVGDCPDWGTWQYHPLVHKFDDLESALRFIVGDWNPEAGR